MTGSGFSRGTTSRLLLGASLMLLVLHLGDLDWLHFLLGFAAIDLLGYLPGAIAHRLSGNRNRLSGNRTIAPLYHHLYNFTHDYRTLAVAALLWAALYRAEWAMLALPLHLAADRGLLGNFKKPPGRPFEEARA
jgi:hypothetical protein